MNKVLVIGGLHGNEPLGLEVCAKLEKLNLPQVDVLYGNPEAINQNRRYIDEDLNRCFPGDASGSLEQSRAAEIMKQAAGYDIVIDFHNTHCPNNDCTFIGSQSKSISQLPVFLGLNRVVLADAYDSINKYVNGCLSVEISLSSPKFSVDGWVEKVISLKEFEPKKQCGQIQVYEFVYRITREEQEKYNFPRWRAFGEVPPKDSEPLPIKTDEPLYAIFVDDAYTPYNYAALIRKVDSPFKNRPNRQAK